MKSAIAWSVAIACTLALGLDGHQAAAQSQDPVQAHVTAARAAAGQDHMNLFGGLCSAANLRPPQEAGRDADTAAGRGPTTVTGGTRALPAPPRRATPDRAAWHVPPTKVFDNLYFVGEKEYSAWAVTTSAGIIVIDTIFDYSVEDEIVGGLKTLGFDPASIKYAIVSHGHADHFGGARYLQDHFGTRVIMSAADWDYMEAGRGGAILRPKRDLVATDGQKLTLGDTTLTLYVTPGHTPGTISTLVPVFDGGVRHLAAEWGGTGFNFPRTEQNFRIYIKSSDRFRDIVSKADADIIIANHTNLDESTRKMPALAARRPGGPHPYVIGNDAVKRYLTVANECAQAVLAALTAKSGSAAVESGVTADIARAEPSPGGARLTVAPTRLERSRRRPGS